MRNVIIDYVRSRNALRNQRQVVTLGTNIPDKPTEGMPLDLL
jgi:hypothetical protein